MGEGSVAHASGQAQPAPGAAFCPAGRPARIAALYRRRAAVLFPSRRRDSPVPCCAIPLEALMKGLFVGPRFVLPA